MKTFFITAIMSTVMLSTLIVGATPIQRDAYIAARSIPQVFDGIYDKRSSETSMLTEFTRDSPSTDTNKLSRRSPEGLARIHSSAQAAVTQIDVILRDAATLVGQIDRTYYSSYLEKLNSVSQKARALVAATEPHGSSVAPASDPSPGPPGHVSLKEKWEIVHQNVGFALADALAATVSDDVRQKAKSLDSACLLATEYMTAKFRAVAES
ncbi:hypothetical protein H0H93_006806 [Arthromyces matolae]|nr:hypothetical protein H0H93_006806 [Arthromyces matolae]